MPVACAGGEWIERSGVADAGFVQTPPGDGDDIVRGETLRLVDDENAVHHARSMAVVIFCSKTACKVSRSPCALRGRSS